MTKLHFNLDLDNQKYTMEFLPDDQVKIIQTGNENRVITFHYLSDTKVVDFMQCIKSWDFSKLKNNELYTVKAKKTTAEEDNQIIGRLKEQIEKMKCCENCRHYSRTYGNCYSYDEQLRCESLSNWSLSDC